MEETFHQRLRRLREAQNINAKEMALQIGIAKTTYNDWENGKGLRPVPYQKMSEVLQVSITELVTGNKPNLLELLTELEKLESQIAQLRQKLLSAT